jgi:hypothetical protein
MVRLHQWLTLLGILALCPSVLLAQASDTSWTRTYGGSRSDAAYCVQQTPDAGYIITGHTRSFGGGSYEIYLIRTDQNGDTLWTKTYGGAGHDGSYSLDQTSDGNYIIAGHVGSSGPPYDDVYLLKVDDFGVTLWTKVYGGPQVDRAHAVQQTSDGGYIVAGYTESFGAGISDIYLLKTDANGDTLWTKVYGGSNSDDAWAVRQTSDGGYVLAAFTSSVGAGSYDAYLLKTDANGDTLWTKTYGGIGADRVFSIEQLPDGGYIATGYTGSFGSGATDLYLIRTNANGDSLWTKVYGGTDYDYSRSVVPADDGGFMIAGFTASFGAGSSDVYLMKTDANGDSLWTKTYGESNDDQAYSIGKTFDGNYIIAGWTSSFGEGSYDVYLLKMETDLVDVAAKELKQDCMNVSQWSPNPFNGEASLQYRLPGSIPARAALYDVEGRRVRTLTLRTQGPGLHVLGWDGKEDNGRDAPSGMYFLKLEAGGCNVTRKVMLIR